MPTPSFRLLVIVFWMGMMGWLFERELLPRLVLGPPPGFHDAVADLADDQETSTPVRWTVSGGTPFGSNEQTGTATTCVERRPDGSVLLSGDVQLNRLPMLGLLEPADQPLALSASTRFYLDSTGCLRHFDIEASVQGIDAPLVVRGRVEGKKLHVTVAINGSLHEETLAYDPRGLVMNSFSPVGRMPNLRVGQAWNIPVVNPLTGRVDLVRAKVTGRELIPWGNHSAVAALVVTQTTGIAGTVARTWVSSDGLVLRQEVPLLLSTMTFERVPDDPERRAR
jgi:hypothetical protein